MRRKYIGCIALALAFVAANNIHAQSLSDYKQALNSSGCQSIPNSNYRDPCQRNQVLVDKYGKSQRSCKGLGPEEGKIAIQKTTARIAEAKNLKEQLNSQRDSATDDKKREIDGEIKSLDDQIVNDLKELDVEKRGLETNRSDIDIRIDNGKQLVQARHEVQEAFASATSSANSENDPEIKTIADQLKSRWITENAQHGKAYEDAEDALDNCKRIKEKY